MTREEAIYRLKNTAWLGTNKDREETEQAIDMAIEALQDRPTGEWKYIATIRSNEYGEIRTHHIWECSECDYEGNPDWPYCPNCGSPME